MLDKLLNKRSLLFETVQTRQKMIRDLGTLPRKVRDSVVLLWWWFVVVVVGVASSVSHNRLEQHSAQAVAVALWLFVVVVTCAMPALSVHRNLATSGRNTNDSCTVVTAAV